MTLQNSEQLSNEELRELNAALLAELEQHREAIKWRDLKIAQLTHEMATLKRWTFGKSSEQVTGLQRSLLEESINEDLEAIATELEELARPRRSERRARRSGLTCRRSCRGSRSGTSRSRRRAPAGVP